MDLDTITKHMQKNSTSGFTKPNSNLLYTNSNEPDVDMMSTINYPTLSMNKSNSFLSSMLQKRPSTSNYFSANPISKGESAFQQAIPSSSRNMHSSSALLGAVTNLIRQSSNSEYAKNSSNGIAQQIQNLAQPLLKQQRSKSAAEEAVTKPMNLRK